jgi:hypothetical protein
MTLQLSHVGDLTDVRVSPILRRGLCSSSPSGETRSLRKAGKGKTGGVLIRQESYSRSVCVGWCCCIFFINVHRQSSIRLAYPISPTQKSTHTSTMTEKYEHSPDLEAQHMDGAPLNRTNTTITLSNEQYERLFFQPSAPRVGDAAKRFGKTPRFLQQQRIII